MRYFTTLAIAIVLGLACSVSFAAPNAELEPLAVTLSGSGKSALTVVKIELPRAPLEQHSQGAFSPEQWHVLDRKNALRQLYVTAGENDTVVNVYGLLEELKDSRLDFYFTRDETYFDEPVLSLTLPARQHATVSGTSLAAGWSQARNQSFARYLGDDQANLPTALLMRIADKVYGSKPVAERASAAEPTWPTLFSLLSGEAAIQETLQQQLLRGGIDRQLAGNIKDLPGPAIDSHPFQQLLQDNSGESLSIAELVPTERYFVHFNDPGRALGALDTLAVSNHTLLGLLQHSYLNRDLINRYLHRLGLSRERVQQLSPLARQAALFGPDPYFNEGTHLTLVIEARLSAELHEWLRSVLGIAGGGEDTVHPFTENHSAYFARHERWLIFSTSATEAEAALQLARTDGQSSLGHSAEFRYMRSLLPAQDDTSSIYIYLSDPFIRALIGPQQKIAQLRRQQARTRLHLVTAAALLYQLDHGQTASLDELLERGYVDQAWLQSWEGDRIMLTENGIAQSSLYGTLASMIPLTDLQIDTISAAEQKGYQHYVDNYSRFWRTTFDPIGIRIDLGEPLRIETLILPLVQNSIYQALRQTIGGEPVSLELPNVLPSPVTTLGVKLPQALLRDWVISSAQGTAPAWLEQLGDSLHIALYDSDPLLALGSANLLGAFSGNWLGAGDDLLLWGVLGSWLTQPSAVFVKLKNTEGAVNELLLEKVLGDWLKYLDFGTSTLEQLGQNGSRGWIYTLNIGGVIRFHLYIRKIYQYLVISNRQINFRADTQSSTDDLPANASLNVAFDQIKSLSPTLHLHRMQRQRQAVMKNAARLLPFMLLGAETPAQAIVRHAEIYGSRPEHPSGGEWLWQPQARSLASDVFGSPWLPRVPSFYDPKRDYEAAGLFDLWQSLKLDFRFEEEGARIMLNVTTGPTTN